MIKLGGIIETAVLGGGCFWCTEAAFQEIEGVLSVESGYSGGHVKNPSYEQVCTGETGHAEVVKVSFDPETITYSKILGVFFAIHDPTTLNRQGNDVGTQYRSVIFYTSDKQKETAELTVRELNRSRKYPKEIVTRVEEFKEFYPSEAYHRDYFKNNQSVPYCQYVIVPKLEKLRKEFNLILRN